MMKMNRRDFLRTAGAAAAAMAAPAFLRAQDTPAKTRPNVILVMTDDQGYGDIGALGNTMIHTPNMDKLWAEARLALLHPD